MKALALFGITALLLCAQSPSRDAYRQAYQNWRQTEPTLEPDAATAGAALEPRAQRAAQAAVAFTTARAAFLDAGVEQLRQHQRSLESTTMRVQPLPAARETMQRVLQPAAQSVTAILTSLTGDTDVAIQQLRQALERERTALNSLVEAVEQRQSAVELAAQSAANVEQARVTALSAYQAAILQRAQAGQQVRKEAAAWQTYYQTLAQGAQGIAPPSASPPPPAGGPTPPAAPKATPPPRTSITPLPLARYVGGWTFPERGLYFGAQPQFIDMVVYEQNGHVTGSLYGRFVLPPGSAGDPVLRFEFEGDLQPERNQKFQLRTTEGATGTIELIPGSAFNLLEVNFQTTPVENKVRSGNFVMLKK
jgi:hypothetical protein